MKFKIFNYHPSIDAFTINNDYQKVAQSLGLKEWSTVVWIGRYFMLDNDYGEHWMDNWELRDELEERAKTLGIGYDELMIIDPDRMQNGKDGPCHAPELRKLFWRDVLTSLELSLELMIAEAKKHKSDWEKIGTADAEENEYISDLEERIAALQKQYFQT